MVRLEEQGCFQEAYPDNNKRPDISLLNLNPHNKIVCDISVAPYPVTGANTLTRLQALQPFRAANNTFQRKIKTTFQKCIADAFLSKTRACYQRQSDPKLSIP